MIGIIAEVENYQRSAGMNEGLSTRIHWIYFNTSEVPGSIQPGKK